LRHGSPKAGSSRSRRARTTPPTGCGFRRSSTAGNARSRRCARPSTGSWRPAPWSSCSCPAMPGSANPRW
jgi:hypothetical protein